MALLFLYYHKESIEKIKNVASGEFKIRFLQSGRERKIIETGSPMTCTKPTFVAREEAVWLPAEKEFQEVGGRETRHPSGPALAGTLLFLPLLHRPILSLLVLLSFLRYMCFHCINVV